MAQSLCAPTERVAMQLLAVFADKAAVARARIGLIELGIPPDEIHLADDRTEDFLLRDDVMGARVSFWAHVSSMVGSVRSVAALRRQMRHGVCLLGLGVGDDRAGEFSKVLKKAGARRVWHRERSRGREHVRPAGRPVITR
jgi:hypothetical protein